MNEETIHTNETQKDKTIENKKISIRNVFDGTIFARNIIIDQLPYIFFLTILAIFYIGNRYQAEKVIKKISTAQNEVKELRSEAIATASELMSISKQSEVLKLVEQNGLTIKESLQPPKKVIVKN